MKVTILAILGLLSAETFANVEKITTAQCITTDGYLITANKLKSKKDKYNFYVDKDFREVGTVIIPLDYPLNPTVRMTSNSVTVIFDGITKLGTAKVDGRIHPAQCELY